MYRQIDNHLLFDKDAASRLRRPQLEVEAAFSELSKRLAVKAGIFGERGSGYFLTEAGKRLVIAF